MKKSQDTTKEIPKQANIAIVHDFLLYPGGAEKVLGDLARMFPEAPIYTILADRQAITKIDEAFGSTISTHRIQTTFLQKFPRWLRKRHRFLAPFFAPAIEALDLRDFDIVISSSGAWSKGVVTRTHTRHFAYLHSPMRFVWDENDRYWKDRREKPSIFRRLFLTYLRVWDAQAADRPDTLIVNSEYTARRVEKFYRREAIVAYPGVFSGDASAYPVRRGKGEYFLIVSRLSASKRIGDAIEICNKLRLPLVIVGEGPERKRLEKMAGETVVFRGWLGKEELEKVYAEARAFLFPCQDDFGIAPVEAMLRGIPAIVAPGASASEIVEDGKTGIVCDASTPDGLADGIRRFLEREEELDVFSIAKHAQKFSREVFEKTIREVIVVNK
jgi:glycosyltransferase involved in cell wall biosynthesis